MTLAHKVLLVDDEPQIRRLLRNMLERAGYDVVQAADDSGSTEYIIKQVTASPAGSVWAVGTEIHLVNRLAREVQPSRTVADEGVRALPKAA